MILCPHFRPIFSGIGKITLMAGKTTLPHRCRCCQWIFSWRVFTCSFLGGGFSTPQKLGVDVDVERVISEVIRKILRGLALRIPRTLQWFRVNESVWRRGVGNRSSKWRQDTPLRVQDQSLGAGCNFLVSVTLLGTSTIFSLAKI